MLRTRGGDRFAGYGNVSLEPGRPTRGWQLTCSQCGAKSNIIYRKGVSYPPKLLYRMFREEGWKISGNPGADTCPACVERTREKLRDDRKQYVNGSADRLIEGIRLVDQLMSASVTAEYGNRQPDVAAAMHSLIETAYLCNMLKREDIPEDIRSSTPPEPKPENTSELERLRAENSDLQARCEQLSADRDRSMFQDFWRDPPSEHGLTLEETWDQAGDETREKTEEPKPGPPSPPPKPEPEPMHHRTAAYLAEMRKAILKDGSVRK